MRHNRKSLLNLVLNRIIICISLEGDEKTGQVAIIIAPLTTIRHGPWYHEELSNYIRNSRTGRRRSIQVQSPAFRAARSFVICLVR